VRKALEREGRVTVANDKNVHTGREADRKLTSLKLELCYNAEATVESQVVS
jgi:hypothetical protein